MPIVQSSYSPSLLLRNGDLHTLIPHFRSPPKAPTGELFYISLPDGDSLKLSIHSVHSSKGVVILTHGLEGSILSPYIPEAASRFTRSGFDAIGWNMRGCDDSPNAHLYWYHSGYIGDLEKVLAWALDNERWFNKPIYLVGFSVGGNITLRLLAKSNIVNNRVRAAACFSVPVDLTGSAVTLAKPRNRLYMRYLLAPLKKRIKERELRFPGQLDTSNLEAIKTFYEFDSRFTAPIHGFSSVEEYWETQSSLRVLSEIKIPTLLVNAKDDPFLSPTCFPTEEGERSNHLYVESPKFGGHVGFLSSPLSNERWSSQRALEFFESL